MTALIEGRQITVRFGHVDEAFDAVHRADISVLPGEAVGVVGESGSGKTTLARVLVGLQSLTEGEVLLEGKRVFYAGHNSQMQRDERWKVQMIFQDPYSSLNPKMRAWQAVAEAIQVWRNLSRQESRTEAFRLLNEMGISEDQAWKYSKSLSGGQRQRVSVARALAPEPRVLIADEPTSSIDQSAQAQLLNLLRRLQLERGLAIIFISHDLALVRYLTSRVYVMQKGVVVEAGDTHQIFNNPQHPYTRLLIASVPGRQTYAEIELENADISVGSS